MLRRVSSAGAGPSAPFSAPAEAASRSASCAMAPLEQLRGVAGNGACADCGKADPDWASLNLGVLLCIECSGVHRRLGVHVSKARPMRLSNWGGHASSGNWRSPVSRHARSGVRRGRHAGHAPLCSCTPVQLQPISPICRAAPAEWNLFDVQQAKRGWRMEARRTRLCERSAWETRRRCAA